MNGTAWSIFGASSDVLQRSVCSRTLLARLIWAVAGTRPSIQPGLAMIEHAALDGGRNDKEDLSHEYDGACEVTEANGQFG